MSPIFRSQPSWGKGGGRDFSSNVHNYIVDMSLGQVRIVASSR